MCGVCLCVSFQALQSGERAPVEPRRPLSAKGGAGGNLQRACSWLGGVPPPAKPVVKRLLLVRARSRFAFHCVVSPLQPTAPLPNETLSVSAISVGWIKYTMSTVDILSGQSLAEYGRLSSDSNGRGDGRSR